MATASDSLLESEILLEAEIEEAEKDFLEDSRVAEGDDNTEDCSDSEFEDSFVAAPLRAVSVDDEVSEYLSLGCGCKKHNGPCSASFSSEEVTAYRFDIAELDKIELDMTIQAQLHAGMNSGDDLLTNIRGSSRPEIHQRVTFTYMFKGKHICREMFCFLHNISRTRLYNIAEHLIANGLEPRVHGNKGRKPKHACHDDITLVVDFVKNCADVHAVPLPGRLPKHQDYRVMKLPSDVTKASVYSAYCSGLERLDQHLLRILSYRQFCRLWHELIPYITTMKPSSDLCMVCQENIAAVVRSSNTPDDEKSEKLKAAQEHVDHAKEERAEYNNKKENSKQAWNNLPSTYHQHGNSPGTIDCTMLYSFDHAQLVHYPSNPLQPGPAYFKTARKCEIFSICCEGSRVQTNYLIDEAESIGKGANSIISYVHHCLSMQGPDVLGTSEQ